MAIVMRMVRATMLEVLGQDYVRTARAKGVGRRTVISKHALRNALIPVVTIVGFEIGVLIGGAAIIETIFGLPGVGYVLLQAIFGRDYPVIQAMTLLIAFTFIFANLLVDILYGVLDPRITQNEPDERPGQRATDRGRKTVWDSMPRRLAFLGKWRNPIGLVGAAIVLFNVLVALFGRFVWRVDPNELVASLRGPELGAPDGHRRARARHAGAHHPRGAGLAPGRR